LHPVLHRLTSFQGFILLNFAELYLYPSSSQGTFLSCPLHFGDFLGSKNPACGPGARASCAKSIGGQRIRSGDPAALPQDGAGHRAPSRAPLHRKIPVLGERSACPPCTIL